MFIASSTSVFGGLQRATEELLPLGINAFEAYELNVPGHPELKHVGVADKTEDELAALRDDLGKQGARLCALSGHTDLLAPSEGARAESVRHLEACLSAARTLDCPIVVTASGHLRGHAEAAMDGLAATLRHLGDAAGEHGVRLAIEAHCGEFIQSTDDLIRLMERVDHPCVAINYDPFHFVFLDEDLAASARAAAPWVAHTHIHDVSADGAQDVPWFEREEVPGRGVIDWRAVLTALCHVGYQGALSIELHKVFSDLAADHRASRDFLLQLMEGLHHAQG